MAYNNPYYPQFYNPYQQIQPQPQQPQAQSPSTSSSMVWVQGEAGAKSYLVAPNTTVSLWDSESQTIYIKSADASGMPSMKILDYTIRETGKPIMRPTENALDYITKKELDEFKNEVKTEVMDMIKKELGE